MDKKRKIQQFEVISAIISTIGVLIASCVTLWPVITSVISGSLPKNFWTIITIIVASAILLLILVQPRYIQLNLSFLR